jgi:hypothetical protein
MHIGKTVQYITSRHGSSFTRCTYKTIMKSNSSEKRQDNGETTVKKA